CAARVALGCRAHAAPASAAWSAFGSRLDTSQEAGARRAGAGTVADSALSGTLRGGFDHADVEGPGGGGLHAALNDAAAGVRAAGAGTVADAGVSGALGGGVDAAGVARSARGRMLAAPKEAGVRRAAAGTLADSALSGALRGGFDHAGVEDPRRRLH